MKKFWDNFGSSKFYQNCNTTPIIVPNAPLEGDTAAKLEQYTIP